VDNRILAMALVHQTLYQRGSLSRINMEEYIPELTQAIFDSYQNTVQRVHLIIDVAPVSLLIDTALSCGLIVSELVSNSLEHAFPGDRSGVVSVSLVQSVNGIVEQQLRGRLEFSVDGGVHWWITFSDDVYRERVRDS
jgi:two-component sensor histidine kinase